MNRERTRRKTKASERRALSWVDRTSLSSAKKYGHLEQEHNLGRFSIKRELILPEDSQMASLLDALSADEQIGRHIVGFLAVSVISPSRGQHIIKKLNQRGQRLTSTAVSTAVDELGGRLRCTLGNAVILGDNNYKGIERSVAVRLDGDTRELLNQEQRSIYEKLGVLALVNDTPHVTIARVGNDTLANRLCRHIDSAGIAGSEGTLGPAYVVNGSPIRRS